MQRCFVHSKARPAIRVVDDIVFRKPVEIGDLLFFSSQARASNYMWTDLLTNIADFIHISDKSDQEDWLNEIMVDLVFNMVDVHIDT